MLEVIDIAGVVSILANIDGSVDSHPRFRFVGCVDLVALEVPRENLGVCLVIKSKLEIGIDSQRIHRAHREARESRSEEHTSELQSRLHLVCRLLLEKKKKRK